jgi:hypothetical protein
VAPVYATQTGTVHWLYFTNLPPSDKNVFPRWLAGHGPTLSAELSKRVDLRLVSRLEFGSGAVAMRYEPGR